MFLSTDPRFGSYYNAVHMAMVADADSRKRWAESAARLARIAGLSPELHQVVAKNFDLPKGTK